MKVFFLLIFLFSCGSDKNRKIETQDRLKTQGFSADSLTYTIIRSDQQTYGYDIYANGKLLIHQSSIPGMPGNQAFKSEQDAEKVAQVVITKILEGQMPPAITINELKKLEIIN
jgi:hypothetical protein